MFSIWLVIALQKKGNLPLYGRISCYPLAPLPANRTILSPPLPFLCHHRCKRNYATGSMEDRNATSCPLGYCKPFYMSVPYRGRCGQYTVPYRNCTKLFF